jgi:hypothetical protein
VRQSTSVPNTSKKRAFIASGMAAPGTILYQSIDPRRPGAKPE